MAFKEFPKQTGKRRMGESKPIDRTASGLRDALFEQLERLRDGKSEPDEAKAFAAVGQTIIKSVEVQMEFEGKKLNNELPAHLPSMKLIPPLSEGQ